MKLVCVCTGATYTVRIRGMCCVIRAKGLVLSLWLPKHAVSTSSGSFQAAISWPYACAMLSQLVCALSCNTDNHPGTAVHQLAGTCPGVTL